LIQNEPTQVQYAAAAQRLFNQDYRHLSTQNLLGRLVRDHLPALNQIFAAGAAENRTRPVSEDEFVIGALILRHLEGYKFSNDLGFSRESMILHAGQTVVAYLMHQRREVMAFAIAPSGETVSQDAALALAEVEIGLSQTNGQVSRDDLLARLARLQPKTLATALGVQRETRFLRHNMQVLAIVIRDHFAAYSVAAYLYHDGQEISEDLNEVLTEAVLYAKGDTSHRFTLEVPAREEERV
jgi:hypothetical protein